MSVDQFDLFAIPVIQRHERMGDILWSVCVNGQWGRSVRGKRSIMIYCPTMRGGDHYPFSSIRETLEVPLDTTPEQAVPLVEALDWAEPRQRMV